MADAVADKVSDPALASTPSAVIALLKVPDAARMVEPEAADMSERSASGVIPPTSKQSSMVDVLVCVNEVALEPFPDLALPLGCAARDFAAPVNDMETMPFR